MSVPDDRSAAEHDIRKSADELLPTLYAEVRRIARSTRLRVGADGTMQTTALINEAYLRLRRSPAFADRQHFLCSAAIAMRQILLNHARDSVAMKRGGGARHVPLEFAEADAVVFEGDSDDALLTINDLLDRLSTLSERLGRVVECRFFAGYSELETAEALGVDERTVRRDWAKARAWLRNELQREQKGDLLGI